MRFFEQVFRNYTLICALSSWFLAQGFKILTTLVKEKRLDFRRFIASGGMPSSHAATVCSLSAATGRITGYNSVEFAISFMLAFIVMYDATGVRRAAGEQARILNRIVNDIAEANPSYIQKKLKEFIGHTPLEVVVGALLGILIHLLIPVF
ncbi:MAG: divergent PAP2 family protein [Eubacteriales bacterium]|jgi:acid phosphatase family membrane protein YuiD